MSVKQNPLMETWNRLKFEDKIRIFKLYNPAVFLPKNKNEDYEIFDVFLGPSKTSLQTKEVLIEQMLKNMMSSVGNEYQQDYLQYLITQINSKGISKELNEIFEPFFESLARLQENKTGQFLEILKGAMVEDFIVCHMHIYSNKDVVKNMLKEGLKPGYQRGIGFHVNNCWQDPGPRNFYFIFPFNLVVAELLSNKNKITWIDFNCHELVKEGVFGGAVGKAVHEIDSRLFDPVQILQCMQDLNKQTAWGTFFFDGNCRIKTPPIFILNPEHYDEFKKFYQENGLPPQLILSTADERIKGFGQSWLTIPKNRRKLIGIY